MASTAPTPCRLVRESDQDDTFGRRRCNHPKSPRLATSECATGTMYWSSRASRSRGVQTSEEDITILGAKLQQHWETTKITPNLAGLGAENLHARQENLGCVNTGVNHQTLCFSMTYLSQLGYANDSSLVWIEVVYGTASRLPLSFEVTKGGGRSTGISIVTGRVDILSLKSS